MCGGSLARTPIDNDRFGSKSFCGARHVDRRIAAAIDHNPASEKRLFARGRRLHRPQEAHGIHDMRCVAGRNVGAMRKRCTGTNEGGGVASRLHLRGEIRNLAAELKFNAQSLNARDFFVKHLPRKTILRDAVAHHAARRFCALHNMDGIAHAAKMISSRKSCRSCTDNQNALSLLLSRLRKLPAELERMVA